MKKLFSALLCGVLSVSLLAGSALADAGLGNFTKSKTYEAGRFADVSAGDWFNESVGAAFEYGLLQGVSQNEFGAASSVTVAEALTMAARLHSIYAGDGEAFAESSPWYQVYVDYCVKSKIIEAGQFTNYDTAATRDQIAQIFYCALPAEALPVINTVEMGAIPDLDPRAATIHVYALYRAGIFTGDDEIGSFGPSRSIKRSEIAAVVTRMAVPALRKSVKLVLETGVPDQITNNAQLIAMVKAARSSASDGEKSLGTAQIAVESGNLQLAAATAAADAAATAAANLTISNGLSFVNISSNQMLAASGYLKKAAAYCEGKAEYAAVYDKIVAAANNCGTAAGASTQLGAGSATAAWTLPLALCDKVIDDIDVILAAL